jgi:YD repeat-containing protein
MILKRAACWIASITACAFTHAQIPGPPANLQSPNVASLGLYGDIPVSLFTGTPSIEIPLYTIEGIGLKIPLSLTYHSAGIRPDQHPGWVGMGWTLQAGGAIYREVRDMMDEYDSPNVSFGARNGYYFHHSVLNTVRWNDRGYLRSIAQDDESFLDTEPDEFSFSFLDYNGKFYLDHLGNWQVQCDRPLRVVFDGTFSDMPLDMVYGTTYFDRGWTVKPFSGFTLIGEDGTNYVFGGTDTSIEYSVGFYQQISELWTASAWYLTKIVSPRGDEISFTYQRGNFVNQMYLSVRNILYKSTESEEPGVFKDIYNCPPVFEYTSIPAGYSGKLLSPVYLESISTPVCCVAFDKSISDELRYPLDVYAIKYRQWYDYGRFYPFLYFLKSDDLDFPACLENLRWYRLDNMIVQGSDGQEVKRFRFEYTNSSSQRLTLSSVHEVAGQVSKTHAFEYNEPERLPRYLSNQVDHWGFYNGRTADDIFDPVHYHEQREPNAVYSQYGVLNKISYPTGGYTRLVFESHSYRKKLKVRRWEACDSLPYNKSAGGLRIKRIVQSPTGRPADEFVEKEYYYVTDYPANKGKAGASSGVLGGETMYGFSYMAYAFNLNDTRTLTSVFSSQSVLPACHNAQGSHIGYSEVVEKRADGSFVRNLFTNFDNGHPDEPADAIIQESRTPYEPYASRSMERGKPILTEEYSATGILKRVREFLYERSSSQYVRAMSARYENICPEVSVSYDEGSSYKIYTYSYRLKEETEKVYGDRLSIPVSTTKAYVYNPYGLVRKVSQTVNGGTRTVLYKRPDEFASGAYPSMIQAGVLSPVVEEVTSFTSLTGSAREIRQVRTDFAVSYPKTGVMVYAVASVKEKVGSSLWRTKYACTHHDSHGNPLLVYRDGVYTVYLWTYAAHYLIAEIQIGSDFGAYTYDEVEEAVKSAYFVDSLEALSLSNGINREKVRSLRSALPKALIRTYSYKPLVGMTSEIAPDGTGTHYEYDGFGRLSGIYILNEDKKEYLDKYQYGYAGPFSDTGK